MIVANKQARNAMQCSMTDLSTDYSYKDSICTNSLKPWLYSRSPMNTPCVVMLLHYAARPYVDGRKERI